MSKEKITILWKQKETSMRFSGYMYGFKRQDGVVGSFSEKLLPDYERIFEVFWLIPKNKDKDE